MFERRLRECAKYICRHFVSQRIQCIYDILADLPRWNEAAVACALLPRRGCLAFEFRAYDDGMNICGKRYRCALYVCEWLAYIFSCALTREMSV